MTRHVIAPVDELPPGTRKFLTIDERPIAIFNIKGEFFGLLNRCPHQGAALCEGPLIGLAQSSDPGEIEYTQAGRNPALPLARLGIRHPYRPVLLRSEEIPHPRLSGQCRAGHQCGEGALRRGDAWRCRWRAITWWWICSSAHSELSQSDSIAVQEAVHAMVIIGQGRCPSTVLLTAFCRYDMPMLVAEESGFQGMLPNCAGETGAATHLHEMGG